MNDTHISRISVFPTRTLEISVTSLNIYSRPLIVTAGLLPTLMDRLVLGDVRPTGKLPSHLIFILVE